MCLVIHLMWHILTIKPYLLRFVQEGFHCCLLSASIFSFGVTLIGLLQIRYLMLIHYYFIYSSFGQTMQLISHCFILLIIDQHLIISKTFSFYPITYCSLLKAVRFDCFNYWETSHRSCRSSSFYIHPRNYLPNYPSEGTYSSHPSSWLSAPAGRTCCSCWH
jgi:hypothetical protein